MKHWPYGLPLQKYRLNRQQEPVHKSLVFRPWNHDIGDGIKRFEYREALITTLPMMTFALKSKFCLTHIYDAYLQLRAENLYAHRRPPRGVDYWPWKPQSGREEPSSITNVQCGAKRPREGGDDVGEYFL